MADLIDRQAAIDELKKTVAVNKNPNHDARIWEEGMNCAITIIGALPSTEPLTDKEQRIFLAAMAREMKICEEVDRNYTREPYEDSLMSVCKSIKRKVKGALWGT